jgi:hypothetical protein
MKSGQIVQHEGAGSMKIWILGRGFGRSSAVALRSAFITGEPKLCKVRKARTKTIQWWSRHKPNTWSGNV